LTLQSKYSGRAGSSTKSNEIRVYSYVMEKKYSRNSVKLLYSKILKRWLFKLAKRGSVSYHIDMAEIKNSL
jgi:hypothetical protein